MEDHTFTAVAKPSSSFLQIVRKWFGSASILARQRRTGMSALRAKMFFLTSTEEAPERRPGQTRIHLTMHNRFLEFA
jgi:hypothetical protein